MHLYFTTGKRVTKDVSKRLKVLERTAQRVAVAHSEEDIHKLRVTYKKIRALLRMSKSAGNKTNIPPDLKKLYASAGVIRDLQLHHQTISSYFQQYNTLPAQYLQHIQHEIKEAIIAFNKIYKRVSFSRAYKQMFVHAPHKLRRKKLIIWHRQHIAGIKTLSGNTITDELIHEIRKHLKDLVYTSQYISSANEHAELAHLLGNYIDSCVLLSFLDKYKSFASSDEASMLEHAKRNWLAEQQAEREKIAKFLATFRGSVTN